MSAIKGMLTALAILTFTNLSHAEVNPPRPGVFVIDDDDGGVIDTFVMWYRRLLDAGTPVRLRGMCVSACTMILMLPREQVCVEPTASFGFHLASVLGHPEPNVTAAYVRRWYPQVVQVWLDTERLRQTPRYMLADTIVSLGIFPACDVVEAAPKDTSSTPEPYDDD